MPTIARNDEAGAGEVGADRWETAPNLTELRGLEVVGLLFLDPAGCILDADVQARKLLGRQLDALLGTPLPEALAAGARRQASEALRRAAVSHDNVALGLPFRSPMEDRVAVAVHPAPSGFTVPVRSGSDHWQHTVARRLRERIIASIPSGIAIVDALDPTHPVRYANDRFVALTGFDAATLARRGLPALGGEPADAELRSALERAAKGEDGELELRLERADGRVFWAELTLSPVRDDQATVTHVLAVLSDVTRRVEAHASLAESERRYRLLAERSSDIVAQLGPDGRPLYVSPALKRVLGFDPVTYTGLDPWRLVHPDDRQRLQAELAAVGRGGPAQRTALFRTRHADGHYVWLDMSVTVIRDVNGRIAEIVAVSRDVSDRMLAREELARSQESFRRLFADNPIPMWVHDGASLELLEVNDAALALLGYDREEILHLPTTAFVPDAQRATYLSAVQAMPPERAHFGDVTVRTKAGSHLIVALDKSPIRFGERDARLVVAQDVTEARRAQRALQDSELRFRRLVEDSNDVIAISDNRGSLTFVSDGVEAIVGYAPDEIVGASLASFIHPDDLPAAERFRREVDAHGSATLPLYRFRHKDGSWRWFEATGRDLRREPAVGGVVINTRDVTERLSHLREIEATREATFRALGLALEYRDLETKGHTDRVVAMSRRFATALGLDDAQHQAITWGAYLHDIGKIAMPDAILLKPGRLTDEEFEVIRRHTLVGEDMCRDIPFLPDATRQLIRSHHERWDARGYPDGIGGEAIPLKARMFALVDVYDALTSERPYKRAWSRQEAEQEIRRQAGTQFDPDLARTFLDEVLP